MQSIASKCLASPSISSICMEFDHQDLAWNMLVHTQIKLTLAPGRLGSHLKQARFVAYLPPAILHPCLLLLRNRICGDFHNTSAAFWQMTCVQDTLASSRHKQVSFRVESLHCKPCLYFRASRLCNQHQGNKHHAARKGLITRSIQAKQPGQHHGLTNAVASAAKEAMQVSVGTSQTRTLPSLLREASRPGLAEQLTKSMTAALWPT